MATSILRKELFLLLTEGQNTVDMPVSIYIPMGLVTFIL
jgi:hypothetical protein